MKKTVIAAVLLTSVLLCGCSGKENDTSSSVGETAGNNDIISVVSEITESKNDSEKKELIEIKESEISVSEGGIELEEAYSLLDDCSAEQLYLPESVKSYKKLCIGIIERNDKKYYSVYNYLENGGMKIILGTNCLVSCDGSEILKKNWMSGYDVVKINTSYGDKSYTENYPGAKISPNDAVILLTGKGSDALELDYDIDKYIYEVNKDIRTLDGVEYYSVTPKLQFTDSITVLSPCYVSTDGNGSICIPDKLNGEKYKIIA